MSLLLGCLVLAGCGGIERMYDSKLSLDQPIDWWHGLEGGPIAEDRPPPPGVDDPYPNLSLVPARPKPTDPAVRRALFARLAAERDRTRQDAIQDPIEPVHPPAAAAPVAPAAPAPADPGASTAVLDAATAPAPVVVAAPTAAPAPPPPAAFTPAPRRPAPDASAPAPEAVAIPAAPIPALPTAPPALPQLAGIPAATVAPATPRPVPAVQIAFATGSDTLPSTAADSLRGLAARRGSAVIQVVAHGDAASASPAAQGAALPLALRRARAIADALAANGVPKAALRSDAAALGRGGSARLVN